MDREDSIIIERLKQSSRNKDKKIERLRKVLKKYGGHESDCDLLDYRQDQTHPNIKRHCTCGFEQVLKGE